MILHNADEVLREIKEFIRKAPASSDLNQPLYTIKFAIENMRKNWPTLSIRLGIAEVNDLTDAEIRLELSD